MRHSGRVAALAVLLSMAGDCTLFLCGFPALFVERFLVSREDYQSWFLLSY